MAHFAAPRGLVLLGSPMPPFDFGGPAEGAPVPLVLLENVALFHPKVVHQVPQVHVPRLLHGGLHLLVHHLHLHDPRGVGFKVPGEHPRLLAPFAVKRHVVERPGLVKNFVDWFAGDSEAGNLVPLSLLFIVAEVVRFVFFGGLPGSARGDRHGPRPFHVHEESFLLVNRHVVEFHVGPVGLRVAVHCAVRLHHHARPPTVVLEKP
mmetsp:Transcript_91851/g.183038  ORF Transcript_91851/g.183038 Transcript_91851/m.183038 type:complete len:206 (-) Transcript_91851:477-1094(-)